MADVVGVLRHVIGELAETSEDAEYLTAGAILGLCLAARFPETLNEAIAIDPDIARAGVAEFQLYIDRAVAATEGRPDAR